jgi:hypothetical protein
LQNLLYRSIREEFDLTAQAAIRCIGTPLEKVRRKFSVFLHASA